MIYLGADHRGFELKNAIKTYLNEKGIAATDLGADQFLPDDDYPDYARDVAHAVLGDPGSFGILACGAGHGMCIQANRFKGIRAILGATEILTERGRSHNNANILVLDADFEGDAKAIVDIFLDTPFDTHPRHLRRIRKLDEPL